MLFVILVLGFTKTPLAYDCLPNAGQSGESASYVAEDGQPCQHAPELITSPPASERECCLFNIDNGLRGAEAGFVLSKADNRDSQQPFILPGAESAVVASWSQEVLVPSPVRPATPALPPPYLVTQRLRI